MMSMSMMTMTMLAMTMLAMIMFTMTMMMKLATHHSGFPSLSSHLLKGGRGSRLGEENAHKVAHPFILKRSAKDLLLIDFQLIIIKQFWILYLRTYVDSKKFMK